jgi:phage host-nuclease inhibitor protein Gam
MNFLLNDIQEFKAKVKAKEEREIAIIRERVLREIQPKYVEIEQMKAEELNSLSNNYNANRNSATEQYNAQLVALQQSFETKKKEVVELAEKRKEELLNATLQTETYEVTKDCERLISDLDTLISKRTEKE